MCTAQQVSNTHVCVHACKADGVQVAVVQSKASPTARPCPERTSNCLPTVTQPFKFIHAYAPCRRAGAAGLEDGTLPFTAIAAARHGFQQLQRLGGFPAISRHTACLSWHLMLRLLQLRHSTGGPVAVLYCHPAIQQLLQEHLTPALTQSAAASSSTSDSTSRVVSTGTTSTSSSKSTAGEGALGGFGTKDGLLVVPEASVMERFRELQGPVVCFNLLRPDGSWVGHKEVGKLAAIHSICLRTGMLGGGVLGVHHKPPARGGGGGGGGGETPSLFSTGWWGSIGQTPQNGRGVRGSAVHRQGEAAVPDDSQKQGG